MKHRTWILGMGLGASLSLGLAAAEPAALSSDQGPVAINPPAHRLPADWVEGPIMEIYVRGFKDSNGDGQGDLNGVTEKLDYLKNLGFTGIWLMPVFASQDHNHGYAPENFRQIEAQYGTMADMQRLLDAAHQRGMGVVLDYIPNHAASSHALFQDSRQRHSAYRDWFVWSDQAPSGNWSGFTGQPWVETAQGWYYAVYDSILPDFNWRNPAVMAFHQDNMKFWLNMGVDGFRMDAVGPLVENGPSNWQNQPENFVILRELQQLLQRYPGPHPMVCEGPGDPSAYAEACGQAFAFGLQGPIIKSVQLGRTDRNLRSYLEQHPVHNMATFLSNHDTFAGPRLFNQVSGELPAYRLAAATQYLLPGTPYTFYGEEVGMAMASQAQGGTDEQIRSPMPWTGHEQGLFRASPDNAAQFNVAAEQQDPNSLLQFYRRLIQLRHDHVALRRGQYQALNPLPRPGARSHDDSVFCFIRRSADQTVLVAINYAAQARSVRLPLAAPLVAQSLRSLWQEPDTRIKIRRGKQLDLKLPSQSFVVLELK